jgi:hypothetical protein
MGLSIQQPAFYFVKTVIAPEALHLDDSAVHWLAGSIRYARRLTAIHFRCIFHYYELSFLYTDFFTVLDGCQLVKTP